FFAGSLGCMISTAIRRIGLSGIRWYVNIWKKKRSHGRCGITTVDLGFSGKVSRDCSNTISIRNSWKAWILTYRLRHLLRLLRILLVFICMTIFCTLVSMNRVMGLERLIIMPRISPIMVSIAFGGWVRNNITSSVWILHLTGILP